MIQVSVANNEKGTHFNFDPYDFKNPIGTLDQNVLRLDHDIDNRIVARESRDFSIAT